MGTNSPDIILDVGGRRFSVADRASADPRGSDAGQSGALADQIVDFTSRRILIVDDVADFTDAIAEQLCRQDPKLVVDVAHNLRDATELVRMHDYDAALVDIKLKLTHHTEDGAAWLQKNVGRLRNAGILSAWTDQRDLKGAIAALKAAGVQIFKKEPEGGGTRPLEWALMAAMKSSTENKQLVEAAVREALSKLPFHKKGSANEATSVQPHAAQVRAGDKLALRCHQLFIRWLEQEAVLQGAGRLVIDGRAYSFHAILEQVKVNPGGALAIEVEDMFIDAMQYLLGDDREAVE